MTGVARVIGLRCNPQVGLSVVQAVMIDMVDNHPFRDIQNYSVHHYCQPFFPFAGPLPSHGIKCIAVLRRVPFVFIEPFVVIRVDDCIFALRKADSPEWIAIAQATIPENRQNNRPFEQGWDFNDKLDDAFPLRCEESEEILISKH